MVDTNIWISAFIFGGLPSRFLTLAFRGAFRLLTSISLLDELDGKLRQKFNKSEELILSTRNDLEDLCEVVSVNRSLSVVDADHDDDRVLECAVCGRADYIVTGDRHLLDLGNYDGIQILTVRRFLDMLAPAS